MNGNQFSKAHSYLTRYLYSILVLQNNCCSIQLIIPKPSLYRMACYLILFNSFLPQLCKISITYALCQKCHILKFRKSVYIMNLLILAFSISLTCVFFRECQEGNVDWVEVKGKWQNSNFILLKTMGQALWQTTTLSPLLCYHIWDSLTNKKVLNLWDAHHWRFLNNKAIRLCGVQQQRE